MRSGAVAFADELAVDEGPAAAPQVANAALRRVDVEQAVMARYSLMILVIGKADMALFIAADQGGGALGEDMLLANAGAGRDGEGDLSGHGKVSATILRARSWGS